MYGRCQPRKVWRNKLLTVRLPAPPRPSKMLQNRLRFVLLNELEHHVQGIIHDWPQHTILVHPGQSNMCENVLQGVSQLEGIDITETQLDVCVNDELGEANNFTAEVEGVSESRFLSLFSGQSPGWNHVNNKVFRVWRETYLTGFRFMLWSKCK